MTIRPHSFQSVATPADSPEGDGGAAPVSQAPGAASFHGLANPIDRYERHRQEVLLYRKRRERREPFTMWDFAVFAEMNSNDLAKDYREEKDGDYHR